MGEEGSLSCLLGINVPSMILKSERKNYSGRPAGSRLLSESQGGQFCAHVHILNSHSSIFPADARQFQNKQLKTAKKCARTCLMVLPHHTTTGMCFLSVL